MNKLSPIYYIYLNLLFNRNKSTYALLHCKELKINNIYQCIESAYTVHTVHSIISVILKFLKYALQSALKVHRKTHVCTAYALSNLLIFKYLCKKVHRNTKKHQHKSFSRKVLGL